MAAEENHQGGGAYGRRVSETVVIEHSPSSCACGIGRRPPTNTKLKRISEWRGKRILGGCGDHQSISCIERDSARERFFMQKSPIAT